MATNIVFEYGDQLACVVTYPAAPVSGDPVIVGDKPGTAIGDEDSDGETVVKFNGVADHPVKAIDGSGNSAVAVNDVIYYVDGDTPPLSKKATGVRYGLAREAITAGATDTINVRIG